jgi:hypothetical protein
LVASDIQGVSTSISCDTDSYTKIRAVIGGVEINYRVLIIKIITRTTREAINL